MQTDHELAIFCKNVYGMRKSRGLSQKELAKIMGIGVGSLRKLERGVLPPRLTCDALFRLAAWFDIPGDRLFRGPIIGEDKEIDKIGENVEKL